MLIAITGADGSGKSTITRMVSEALAAVGISSMRVDKWDIYNVNEHPECRFLRGPLSELRQCISEMSVPARTLFLFWSMYLTTDEKALDRFETTVVDSYWIKHAASEQIYGAPETLINIISSFLPVIDLAFVLDLAPQVAWQRKSRTNFRDVVPYECGMDPELTESSFISHQRKLRRLLRRWVKQRGWTLIDATKPPSEIVDEIVATVSERIRRRRSIRR